MTAQNRELTLDRDTEDRIVLGNLRTLCLGLIVLFTVLSVFNAFSLEPRVSLPIISLNLAFMIGLALLRAALIHGKISARRSHPLAAVITLFILSNLMLELSLTGAPGLSVYLQILIIGIGCLILSHRWLAALIGISMTAWFSIASMRLPGHEIYQSILPLAVSTSLAIIIHTTRRNGFRQMEALRLRDRKRQDELESALKAAAESEERYRSLVDQSPIGILVHDGERILFVNETAVALAGAESADDLLGRSVYDLVHPDRHEFARRRNQEILSRRVAVPYLQSRLVRLDGESFDVEIAGIPATYHDRPAVQVIYRDISERIAAEKELHESRERLKQIYSSAGDGIFLVDPEERVIREVNPKGARMLGYSPEELAGKPIAELHPEEMERAFEFMAEVTRNGEAVTDRLPIMHRKGHFVDVEISASIFHENEKTLILAMVRDITERRRAEKEKADLEAQLRQTQKLEAIGSLAGGIAHDFNNLLAGIKGYAEILKCGRRSETEVVRAAEVIEKAADRATHLTRQLLGFARKGKLQIVQIEMNEVILEVEELLNRTIDKKIQILHDFKTEASSVLGDPGQLQSVVLNLALNARDAMPNGGRLRFNTDRTELDDIFCAGRPGMKPGPYVVISVSDTGCGIPSSIREKIFDPFFTTKGEHEGSGMGLAMAYGIVKNHGGGIYVYSEEGRGTTFRIYLPAAETEAHDGHPAAETTNGQAEGNGNGKRARVLVVDDEDIVRQMAADMLIALGHEVVTAANGGEALEIFRKNEQPIDLAIIDMVMPQMGGRECFLELKKLSPDLRAILSTGYGRDGIPQSVLNEGMCGFVQKPYAMSEFSRAVAEALES